MTENNRETAVERGEQNREQAEWTHDLPPSIAVVEAVARSRNCDPRELESLDDIVDTDALNALFTPRYDGSPRGSGSLSFPYEQRDVTVFSDGRIVVERP